MVFNILKAPKPKTLEQKLDARTSVKRDSPVNYAVLFSGNSEFRHRENLFLAYQTALLNGYLPEDIFIFDATGKKSPHYPVTDVASKEALEMTTKYLSGELTEEDVLFLYMTDHGERKSMNGEKVSTITTPRFWRNLNELEVADWISQIHPKSGVLVYDQCYSGGFAKRSGKGNYVAVSSCRNDEVSYGNSFPKTFFGAIINQSIGKSPSVQELFDFTLQNDKHVVGCFPGDTKLHHPQIFSEINPREVYLSYK